QASAARCESHGVLMLVRPSQPRSRRGTISDPRRGIEHDQMVGELVGIVAAGGVVLTKEPAAGIDGCNYSFVTLTPGQMMGELSRDPLPGLPGNLLVNGIVGNHRRETLGEGHVDEDAGASLGGVQVARQELLNGSLMCPCPLNQFRHEGKAKRLP